jgi:hypothetical protein
VNTYEHARLIALTILIGEDSPDEPSIRSAAETAVRESTANVAVVDLEALVRELEAIKT